ncbi:unnamed protein product [Brassica napus]|nr:unnamed protein product [Brassica napus]
MQRLQISSRPSEEFLINLLPNSSSPDDLSVYDVAKKDLMLHNNSYKSVNGESYSHNPSCSLSMCFCSLGFFKCSYY